VKLPTVRAQEPNPPTGAQFLKILDNVPEEWLLPFVTHEATGCYLDEILTLTWGDVDAAERKVMARACKLAGIPHYSPKNLRERRASIWHHGGLPAKTLAERLGHAKASMSLDVYTDTLDAGEGEVEELQARVAGR